MPMTLRHGQAERLGNPYKRLRRSLELGLQNRDPTTVSRLQRLSGLVGQAAGKGTNASEERKGGQVGRSKHDVGLGRRRAAFISLIKGGEASICLLRMNGSTLFSILASCLRIHPLKIQARWLSC